jgi:hypothetical protein
MKNMPTGDGNSLGVVIAFIMLALGVAAFVSNVGLSRTAYMVKRAVHAR